MCFAANQKMLCCLLVMVALASQAQTTTPSGTAGQVKSAQKPKPCAESNKRKFDFWVGEWEVKTPKGTLAGSSHIELILDACVVFENWSGARGYQGKSFNFYDDTLRKWRQIWVDNQGGVLDFVGDFSSDSELQYEGKSVAPTGGHILHRLSFFKLDTDRVRQLWEQSEDSGKTWKVVFDGMYFRRKS